MSIQAINVIGNDTFNSLYSETKYIPYNKATIDATTSKAFGSENTQNNDAQKSTEKIEKTNLESKENIQKQSEPSTKPAEDSTVVSLSSDEKNPIGEELSDDAKATVEELKRRDQKVRQHEQAHVSAGQGLVISGPTYEYQTGPDGKKYAVGGEVRIDTSMPEEPQEAVEKARKIKAAALAPSEPSSQDLAIAQKAQRMEQIARQELARIQEYSKTAERGGGEISHLTAYNEPSLVLQSGVQRIHDSSSALKTSTQRVAFNMINGDLKMDTRHILESIMSKSVNVVA